MSAYESSNPSLSRRQRSRRAEAERQWLALGAARERSRCAASISHDRDRQLKAAIDGWENEGGRAAGVALPLRPKLLRKLTTLQLSADLFRDDTLMRAVILNSLLLLAAGTALTMMLNN